MSYDKLIYEILYTIKTQPKSENYTLGNNTILIDKDTDVNGFRIYSIYSVIEIDSVFLNKDDLESNLNYNNLSIWLIKNNIKPDSKLVLID